MRISVTLPAPRPVLARTQLAPPSVVLYTPLLGAPAYAVFALAGCTASTLAIPPSGAPIRCQLTAAHAGLSNCPANSSTKAQHHRQYPSTDREGRGGFEARAGHRNSGYDIGAVPPQYTNYPGASTGDNQTANVKMRTQYGSRFTIAQVLQALRPIRLTRLFMYFM